MMSEEKKAAELEFIDVEAGAAPAAAKAAPQAKTEDGEALCVAFLRLLKPWRSGESAANGDYENVDCLPWGRW